MFEKLLLKVSQNKLISAGYRTLRLLFEAGFTRMYALQSDVLDPYLNYLNHLVV